MKSITFTALITSCVIGTAALATGCQSHADPVTASSATGATATAMTPATAQAVTLDLTAGQVLQMAMPKPKSGDAAKAARQAYYQTALPLAEDFGDERLGMLQVTDTVVGTPKPSGLIFYAFPDEASRDGFEAHPDWPQYKAQRPQGWDELMVYSTTMREDLTLKFDPNKHYTLAIAWTNPESPDDYARYLEGVETDFDRVGARFMYEFKDIGLETHQDATATGPTQMTLVEWDTHDGLMSLLRGDAYKANAENFSRGVTDIQLYRLGVPKPT